MEKDLQPKNKESKSTKQSMDSDKLMALLLEPKRLLNETYEQYKERRAYANKMIKKYINR